MHKWNLLKKTAPCILSLAVAATTFPTAVMASEFDAAVVSEADEQTGDAEDFGSEEAVEDVADGDVDTIDVTEEAAEDIQQDETADDAEIEDTTAEPDPFSDSTEADQVEVFSDSDQLTGEYQYVYAGLTWGQYWAAEGVYAAGDTSSNDVKDSHNELDKGAFDTVTRATTNHGLHRGSFQTETTIVAEDGSRYPIAAWTDQTHIKLTNGDIVGFSRGTITKTDGTTVDMEYYEVYGLKYVPVAVKTEDYTAFCQQYNVVANDGVLELSLIHISEPTRHS